MEYEWDESSNETKCLKMYLFPPQEQTEIRTQKSGAMNN